MGPLLSVVPSQKQPKAYMVTRVVVSALFLVGHGFFLSGWLGARLLLLLLQVC